MVPSPHGAQHGPTPDFATFAEMQTWGKSATFRVCSRTQTCNGWFTDEAYEPFVCLDPLMEKLGFLQPVAMGDRCRVYDDVTLLCSGSIEDDRDKYRFYEKTLLLAQDCGCFPSALTELWHHPKGKPKLALLEPGGGADRPLDVSSASVIESRAEAEPCLRCNQPMRAVDNTTLDSPNGLLRKVKLQCRDCGDTRELYLRIVGSYLSSHRLV